MSIWKAWQARIINIIWIICTIIVQKIQILCTIMLFLFKFRKISMAWDLHNRAAEVYDEKNKSPYFSLNLDKPDVVDGLLL